MKLNTLLVFFMIVASIFGIGFLFFTRSVLAVYGSASTPGEIQITRLLGALTLGYVVLAGVTRKITDPTLVKSILLSFFVSTGFTFAVFLNGVISGEDSGIPAWFNVGLFTILFTGFGFFYFRKERS